MPAPGNPLNVPFFRDTVEGDRIADNLGAATGGDGDPGEFNIVGGFGPPIILAADHLETFYVDVFTTEFYDVENIAGTLVWVKIEPPAPDIASFFQNLNFTTPANDGDVVGSTSGSLFGINLAAPNLASRPIREGNSVRFDTATQSLFTVNNPAISGSDNYWFSMSVQSITATGNDFIASAFGTTGGARFFYTFDINAARITLNYGTGFPAVNMPPGHDFTDRHVYTFQYTDPELGGFRPFVDGTELPVQVTGGNGIRNHTSGEFRFRFSTITYRMYSFEMGTGILTDTQRSQLITNQLG